MPRSWRAPRPPSQRSKPAWPGLKKPACCTSSIKSTAGSGLSATERRAVYGLRPGDGAAAAYNRQGGGDRQRAGGDRPEIVSQQPWQGHGRHSITSLGSKMDDGGTVSPYTGCDFARNWLSIARSFMG